MQDPQPLWVFSGFGQLKQQLYNKLFYQSLVSLCWAQNQERLSGFCFWGLMSFEKNLLKQVCSYRSSWHLQQELCRENGVSPIQEHTLFGKCISVSLYTIEHLQKLCDLGDGKLQVCGELTLL